MNKFSTLIAAVVAVVLVVVIAVYFRSTHHYVENNRWRGLQGKARTDGFWLAEQFLKQKGYDIQRQSSYARLSQADLNNVDTVFFSNDARTLSERQAKLLGDWVRAGGHVVINRPINALKALKESTASSKPAPFFSQTGLQVNLPKNKKCTLTANEKYHIGEDDYHEAVEVLIKNATQDKTLKSDAEKVDALMAENADDSSSYTVNGAPLSLNFSYGAVTSSRGKAQRLYHLPAKCAGDVFSVFSLGRGRITVYSLPPIFFSTHNALFLERFWHNDNATLLDMLLQTGNNEKKPRVLWFERAVYPSALSLLWQYWAFALLTAGLLLLAWVWRHSRRFGSLLVEDQRQGLTLARHLRATGRFYYQNDKKNILLQHCYERLDRTIARRISSHKRLQRGALAEKIAEKTGLSTAIIADVLAHNYPHSDSEFTQLIYYINEIQRRL